MFQGPSVSRCRFCALASDQVELGQLLPLVRRGDQSRAPVELIDDLEDRLLPLLGGSARDEKPPYQEWVGARRSSGMSKYDASCTRS